MGINLTKQVAKTPLWKTAGKALLRSSPVGILIEAGAELLDPDPVADGTLPPNYKECDSDYTPDCPNPSQPPKTESAPPPKEPPIEQPRNFPQPSSKKITYDVNINIEGSRRPTPKPPVFPTPNTTPTIPTRRLEAPEDTLDTNDLEIPEKKLLSVKKDALKRTYGDLLHSPVTKNSAIFYQVEPNEDLGKNDPTKAGQRFYEYLARSIHGSEIPEELVSNSSLALNLIPNNFLRYTGTSELSMVFGTGLLSEMANSFRASSRNAFQSVDGLSHINVEYKSITPEKTEQSAADGLLPTLKKSAYKFSKRSYEILGGDNWYSEEEGNTPKLEFDNPEDALKASADSQNLDDPESSSENNTDNIIDLLAGIYYRMGGAEFPAELPPSLSGEDDDGEPIKVNNQGKLWEWYLEQFDLIAGQFPIKIKVEDNDLIATGDQDVEITLPNIAETLAEIMGKSIMNEARLKALLATNLKEIAEIGSSRILTIKNHALLNAIQEYLGFGTEQSFEEVDFNFNPIDTVKTNFQEGDESLSTALSSKKAKIETVSNKDSDTLEEKLTILVEMARMYKGKNYQPINLNNNPKGQLLDILKNASSIISQNQENAGEDFTQWLDKIENEFADAPLKQKPEKPYGKEQNRRPKVTDIGNQDNNS